MDQQQGLQVPTGPGGRRLHIAHRRSPSELTPLMMEQLAIQQQIEALQQQQQQIAATHQQYVKMGMIPPQQHLPQGNAFAGNPNQMQGMSPQTGTFQFPQQITQQQQQPQQQQQMGMPQHSHRRNQSAIPNMGMGPPPAPSSGLSGSNFADMNNMNNNQLSRENVPPRAGRGGPPGGGHTRRHSLALPEAKKAAEVREQNRKTSGFQFPIPSTSGSTSPGPGQATNAPVSEAIQANQGGFNSRPARGSLHGRSQSMAVGNGRGSLSGRATGAGLQLSSSVGSDGGGSDFQRRGSSHGRSASRNFEGNWRQQQQQQQNNGQQQGQDQQQQQMNMGNFQMNQNQGFQPGHRVRGSVNQSISSMAGFQYPNQPQVIQLPQGQVLLQQPQIFAGQGMNQLQLAQLQALQNAQITGQGMPGLQASQHAQMPGQQGQQNQGQQQQRKTLFTPYLPQATLPALLNDGQLVAGTLRVNKKNRSDAYVTTSDLDADIFICGSKDRNRALEGDLVAIELLDVDEVWGQKREKEEKKKRKDVSDNRGNNTSVNDATTGGEPASATEGGIRRRGSLRQRPTQKKNDDVEVEGQSLLLMEEDEINDEQKPLYAGHVVAVIERMAGQMFSGTLGLLRPSSQATKEKQEAERQARDGAGGRNQQDRQQDKPKIVWFKPTDKRVPLIAIPTEQAPRDFVEKHEEYAKRIFVACIKRWPITSLHPFGTLVEQLGEMGDLKVETDALLRDNNFGPDDFSDAVLRSVGFDDWSVANDGEAALASRHDFRNEDTFTIDPNGADVLDNALHVKSLNDGKIEIGVHVTDVAHFIKANSLVDREAKKRGTGVYLMNRTVNMLPPRLCADLCSLSPGQDRYTVSVVFKIDAATGRVFEDETWIGKSVVSSAGKLSYDDVNAVLSGADGVSLSAERSDQIRTLQRITQRFRQVRFGDRTTDAPALRLLYQLDDENVPVAENIFDSSPAHELIEELSYKTNAFVARKIFEQLGDKALLRSHSAPNHRRLQQFAERMTNIGYEIDTTSSGDLQNSLFFVDDAELRKGMETLLVKTMQRAKYTVAGKVLLEDRAHFALNLPVYTHFTNPSRRYADIIVHRQLEAVLSGDLSALTDDVEGLTKIVEMCNTKKDSAQSAQEQSVHIESCRKIDRKRNEAGGDLICEGIVLCVYESAFDVLIPEYGFEKRVHCDQLPLKKAEFDKHKRVLELYWEKGVPSSAYVPEDERFKSGSNRISHSASTRHSEAAKREQEHEEARRRQLDTGTISTDDTEALFDDDDDDEEDEAMSEITEATAGVSLSTSNEHSATPTKETRAVAATPESKSSQKDAYRKMFSLREENGEHIQDIREMTRVPVILKTDLSKSPPCLTIRSVNPYSF